MVVISLTPAQAAEHGKQEGYPAVMFKGKLYTGSPLLARNIGADANNQATALKERLLAAGKPDIEAMRKAERAFPTYGKNWRQADALFAAEKKKVGAMGMDSGPQQWRLSNIL